MAYGNHCYYFRGISYVGIRNIENESGSYAETQIRKGKKNSILKDKFLHKWHIFSKFILKLESLETNHIIMH